MNAPEWERLRSALAGDIVGRFGDGDVEGLPEPVVRYFRASVRPGTAVIRSIELAMTGRIRIGRWIPFRAREVLDPHSGFVWAARAAGIVTGSDRYHDGVGAMEWKALGLVPVLQASGPDVSLSAAQRAASEAVWVPTAMAPRFGVTWTAPSDYRIEAEFGIDGHPVRLTLSLDPGGLPTAFDIERWGDPDGSGEYGFHRFGGDFSAYRTFHGLTVPSAGAVGWHHGTDAWDRGEFFRFELDRLEPVDPVPSA